MTPETSPRIDDQEDRSPTSKEATQPADPSPAAKARPDDVPEKFWDQDKSEIRVESLLRSYRELERRLGRSQRQPDDGATGDEHSVDADAPGPAEDYAIEPPHPAIEVDPDVNQRLHAAGFTQAQAQLVYDLAAEHLLPALGEAESKLADERERGRLADHFGKENWPAVQRQLDAWGKRSLTPEIYATLASSHDGVLIMHDMMRRAEPEIVGRSGEGAGLSEARLNEMVRNPRYWRDRDPAFVGRVTEGFKRLYGG